MAVRRGLRACHIGLLTPLRHSNCRRKLKLELGEPKRPGEYRATGSKIKRSWVGGYSLPVCESPRGYTLTQDGSLQLKIWEETLLLIWDQEELVGGDKKVLDAAKVSYARE